MKMKPYLIFTLITFVLLSFVPNTFAQDYTLIGHTESVINVSFSPDGSTLASSSGDGTVLLWMLN